MKNIIALLAGLAIAGTAFAQVDPTRPMVTGRGNVEVRPARVIVTNQTKTNPGETLVLEKFQVTGSLLRSPTKTSHDAPLTPAPASRKPSPAKATTTSAPGGRVAS